MIPVNRLSLNMDQTVVLHCRVPKAPIGECGELFESLYTSTDFNDGIPLPDGTTINLKEEDGDYQEELTETVKIAVDDAIDEAMDEAISTGFWAQHRWLLIGILAAVLLVALLVLYGVWKGPVYLQMKFDDFKKFSAAKTTEIFYELTQKGQTQPTDNTEPSQG